MYRRHRSSWSPLLDHFFLLKDASSEKREVHEGRGTKFVMIGEKLCRPYILFMPHFKAEPEFLDTLMNNIRNLQHRLEVQRKHEFANPSKFVAVSPSDDHHQQISTIVSLS